MIIMLVYINYKQKIIMDYLWMAFYCLVGIFVSENYFCKEEENFTTKEKILATFICLSNGALIFFIFKHLLLPNYLHEMKWLIMGTSLPVSRCIASKLAHYSQYKKLLNDRYDY